MSRKPLALSCMQNKSKQARQSSILQVSFEISTERAHVKLNIEGVFRTRKTKSSHRLRGMSAQNEIMSFQIPT